MPDLRTPMAPIRPSQASSFGLVREYWGMRKFVCRNNQGCLSYSQTGSLRQHWSKRLFAAHFIQKEFPAIR